VIETILIWFIVCIVFGLLFGAPFANRKGAIGDILRLLIGALIVAIGAAMAFLSLLD
jgi:hypothetical protein